MMKKQTKKEDSNSNKSKREKGKTSAVKGKGKNQKEDNGERTVEESDENEIVARMGKGRNSLSKSTPLGEANIISTLIMPKKSTSKIPRSVNF